MADLVTLAELKAFLNITATTDDALLTSLLNDVEALYESATLRPAGYYTSADTGRVEVKDGTGSKYLYLDYPISAVTSVTLGYDSAAPDDTLDATNKAVLSFGVGTRRLTRTDGGWFGTAGLPRYVEVTYDHLGNLPEDANLPIMEVVASMYRNRGSEGMKSETVGNFYSYTRDDVQAAADTNPHWQQSVENNRPGVTFA